MKTKNLVIALLLSIIFTGCKCKSNEKTTIMNGQQEKNWEQQLDEVLPLLGHRNWILIVDKAFPLQSAAGMTYINTQGDLLHVLGTIIEKIKNAPHVQGIFYTDKELQFLTEDLVPGIGAFKEKLNHSLEGNNIQTLYHNDIFERLDNASKLFNIVVLKTDQVMPYTSIFIELDCGYWSSEKETQLRQSMSAKQN